MAETPTTVVIADDHAVIRSSLRLLLGTDEHITVVAEAGDVDEAVRTLGVYRPDVLLLDLHMGVGTTLAAIPRLREASPRTRIVMLTMQNSPAFVREALVNGVDDYVTKDAAPGDLADAVLSAR